MSSPGFIRVLKRKDVLAIAFGAMIGWGWVVLAGGWVVSAGSLGAVSAFLIGGPWAGKLLVLAGIGGIVTSWNAFIIGGSRAIYAMAHAGQLPAFLGKLHPRYNTPVNAIVLIGALSVIAPLFGRKALVWLVNAGGVGIVLAYATVALSFLVLRRREPNMVRPFRVPGGAFVGTMAVVLSLGIMCLYLPGSPAALAWPYEWLMVIGWGLLGAGFYLAARFMRGGPSASEDRNT